MIELPDEKWTPYVTVIGIGELGVRVLLRLSEQQREDLKLCAIVSDKTQMAGHENQFSAVFVGDVKMLEQQSDFHHLIQNSIMFLVVADTTDAFSERMVSAITATEQKYESYSCYCDRYAKRQQNIVSFAMLITPTGNEEQGDYIHQTRAIYMTPDGLRRQCEIQPELFADEVGVIAEMAAGFANMLLLNVIFGLDVADIYFAFARSGKMTAVFGQGNTSEEAVDDLLLAARNRGMDLKRCELAVFSMSGASNRLSIYDVNEAPELMAKKVGRDLDSLSGDSLTLLSGPIDDSLGNTLKILAVFCEMKREECLF